MELQRVAPVRLVAIRLDPEDPSSLVEQASSTVGDRLIARRARCGLGALGRHDTYRQQTDYQDLRGNGEPEPTNCFRLHIVPFPEKSCACSAAVIATIGDITTERREKKR